MEINDKTSLADRAAISIIISLWHHDDVLEKIRKYSSEKNFDEIWTNMENKIIHNIDFLPITANAKEYVLNYCFFIGQDIKQWMQNHKFLTIDSKRIATLLCLNFKCLLDYEKTARRIILHETDDLNRFRVACINCMEDYINQLWPLVRYYFEDASNIEWEPFEIRYWVSYLKEDTVSLMREVDYIGPKDALQFAFNLSIMYNNLFCAEYFLNKMKKEQIPEIVNRTLENILSVPQTFNYRMIPLFVRYLNNERLDDLINKYPETILMQYLEYNFLDNFLLMADKAWRSLPGEGFYVINETLAYHLHDYLGNRIFITIFKEFWESSPSHCKEYVINKCITGSFLIRLALLTDTTCVIQSIIQSATIDQKRQMCFSYNGMLFFDSLI
ncbi:hypothetical protein CEXT_3181, partial [Caerostris extrusa]